MSTTPPNPFSGIVMFEVVAKDGRRVRLHEDWYHVHILQRKPEIGGLAEPLEQIKRALIEAEDVKKPDYSARPLYIGPPIGKGFFRDYCLHVAVQPQKPDRGVVFTVIMKKAEGYD